MAHYDLEEQEQIDSLKTWWNMHGGLITGVVTAICLAVIAWQGWNWYQRSQAAQAASVFAVLEQSMAMGDSQKIKASAGELTEKFASTPYAALGALLAARQSFEAGDLKTAKAQLTWASENGKEEIRDIARLRLAAVLLDEKAFDEAVKVLEAAPDAPFAARSLELKGDVLTAQGKRAEARTAYKAALEKSSDGQGASRELLLQKLDSLGEAA